MQRYFGPILVIWLSVMIIWSSGAVGQASPDFSSIALGSGAVLYLLGAFWWLGRATAPGTTAWPHALVIWAVAIPPTAIFAVAMRGAAEIGKTLLGAAVGGIPALLVFVICLSGTLVLIRRGRRATLGSADDQSA